MRIRLATEEDLPKLKLLVTWCAEELEKKFGTPRADDLIFWEITYGVRAKDAVVVAEDEYLDIVGWCARVKLPGLPEGYTEGVGTWVHPNTRQERIAADMRKFADEHAKSRGVKYVTGIAAKDNVAGIQSCIKEGYEIVGYLMRKSL